MLNQKKKQGYTAGRRKRGQRWIALALSLVLSFSLLPITALADGEKLTKEDMAIMTYEDVMSLSAAQANYVYGNGLFYALPIDVQMQLIKGQFKRNEYAYLEILTYLYDVVDAFARTALFPNEQIQADTDLVRLAEYGVHKPLAEAKIYTENGDCLVDFDEHKTATDNALCFTTLGYQFHHNQLLTDFGGYITGEYAEQKEEWLAGIAALIDEELTEIREGYEWFNTLGADKAFERIFKEFCKDLGGKDMWFQWRIYQLAFVDEDTKDYFWAYPQDEEDRVGQYCSAFASVYVEIDGHTIYFPSPNMVVYLGLGGPDAFNHRIPPGIDFKNTIQWQNINAYTRKHYANTDDFYDFRYEHNAMEFWSKYAAYVEGDAKFITYNRWVRMSAEEKTSELDKAAFFYVATHTEEEVRDFIPEMKSLLTTPYVSVNGYEIELTSAERAEYESLMLTHVRNGYARDTSVDPEDIEQDNTYLLRVDTGVNPGRDVVYFGIRYWDGTDERTEVVLPHMGSLTQGYHMAEDVDSPGERLDLMNSITGYTVGNDYEDADGLMANSFDTYLFKTGYPIVELKSIDVFMNYPTGKDENGNALRPIDWGCSGMYLYDVENLYGVKMAGYYSGNFSISFKGKMIAKLYNDYADFTVGQSDQLYRLEAKNTADITNVSRQDANNPCIELVDPTAPENLHDDSVNEYLFKLDFADIYGAGIEALATEVEDGKRLKQPVEAMTLEVKYTDDVGEERTVDMPVITSMLTWAVEDESIGLPRRLPIVGVAQQGESVMFPGVLPNFQSLKSVDLYYGTIAETKARIAQASDATYNTVRSRRLSKLAKDAIQITGIQIYQYKEDMVQAELTNDAMLTLSVKNEYNPLYYYTSTDSTGMKCLPNAASGINLLKADASSTMSEYTSGASLTPPATSSNYVIMIETDVMPQAATTEDVTLTLEYKSTDGTERTTSPILLRSKAQEFYGYWPGRGGNDVSYNAAMSAGGTLVFGLNLTDALEFTKATFTMSSYATDEWQMKSFRILNTAVLGKRVAEWKELRDSDRLFTRTFSTADKDVIARYPNGLDDDSIKVFLSGVDNQVTIELSSENTSTVKDTDPFNWVDLQYSMTYKESKQDLGFVHTAETYRVDVEVASNAQAGSDGDDCGSNNLFYFKLLFENGSSGYVLANQQLTSDGFRAGRTESFYINTNKDYGTLSAISIIPEDNSGSDNQDPFDKINVTRISVTKDCSGGLSKTWLIDNVGWIDIDYYDRGAESTSRGRAGRTEGEIARNYVVTSEGYSVNLMFALATKSYERSASDVFKSADNLYNPTLKGSVVATIEYFDRSGMLRKQSIDVVRAIYDYDGKIPQYYGEQYVTVNGIAETRAKSNEAFMFRGNHIDRFNVSLLDVRQLKSIDFGISAEVSTNWKLDSVTVYRVMSDGRLQLNAEDEFQRNNEVQLLCESTNVMGYDVKTLAPFTETDVLGAEQPLTVDFTANPIDIEETESGWSVVMKEEPTNKNDTLNLYIHMMDEAAMEEAHSGIIQTALSEYDMQAQIEYHRTLDDRTDTIIVDTLSDLQVSEADNMFYCEGIKATGFNAIRSLSLRASSPAFVNAYVDYVDIQHVRSGVALGTYRVYFGKNVEPTVNVGGYAKQESFAAPEQPEQQTVHLYLAPGTESTAIKADENDLVVSIRYRTSNSVSGMMCDSKNVFLSKLKETDGTDLKYPMISSGTVLEIPFKENCVEEITGITVTKIGKGTVLLDSAYVTTTCNDTDTGWYSFSSGKTLTTAPTILTPSYYNVMPVKVTLTTGTQGAEIIDSKGIPGGEAPVRMTVRYHNANSAAVETYIIPDIRSYITSGNLKIENGTDNGTAVMEFALKNAKGIRSIILEPYTTSEETSAAWDVDTLQCEYKIGCLRATYTDDANNPIITETYPGSLNSGDGTVAFNSASKQVDLSARPTIYEDSPLEVNLSTIQVKLEISTYNTETKVNQVLGSITNSSLSIEIPSGKTLTVATTLTGSLDGYGLTAELKKDNVAQSNKDNAFFSMDNRTIRFKPLEAGEYAFTVASEEDPTMQATVNITVTATSSQNEDELEDENEPESGNEPETGSGTETEGGTETETGSETGTGSGTGTEDGTETDGTE